MTLADAIILTVFGTVIMMVVINILLGIITTKMVRRQSRMDDEIFTLRLQVAKTQRSYDTMTDKLADVLNLTHLDGSEHDGETLLEHLARHGHIEMKGDRPVLHPGGQSLSFDSGDKKDRRKVGFRRLG